MEQVVVAVPRGIPLQLIGLKQRVFEKKHGVTFQLDQARGEIVLTGGANQIKDTQEELLAVFARMRPSSASATAAVRAPAPAPVPASTASPARSGPARFFAAKDAREHSWEFVAAEISASDVDADTFSHELVHHPHHSDRQSLQQRYYRKRSQEFMDHFDIRYIEAMANVVDRRVGPDFGDVKVDRNFGHKLFQLIEVKPNREYSWEELRGKNRYSAVKYSWSNVVDPEAPGMRELIADLRVRAAELGIQEPKEKLTVWIKVGDGNQDEYQIHYVRRDGAWEITKSTMTPVPHIVHDIILASRLNLRMWVYPKRVPVDSKWDHVTSAVVLHEGVDSGIFGTKVSLADGIEEGQARIKWAMVKLQLEIPFAGLRFKLVQGRDGELLLEVGLPKNLKFESTPGGKFAQLLRRVDAVFARYAVGEDGSR